MSRRFLTKQYRIDELERKLSSANARIKELETKVRELNEANAGLSAELSNAQFVEK